MKKYPKWLEEVDALVEAALGLSIHDLPDLPYRSWYADGMDPEEVSEEVMEEVYNSEDWA